MMARPPTAADLNDKESVLVITGSKTNGAVTEFVRDRYPEFQVGVCQSYLNGVLELTRSPSRAVVAAIDGGLLHIDRAVAGLREAAGPNTRIILCCHPDAEPAARKAVQCGADDYVLLPLDGDELDRALGYGRPAVSDGSDELPRTTAEEMTLLAETLAQIGHRPMAVIERLAKLVRTALQSRGATVVVQGAVATDGEPVTKPVLSAPLLDNGRTIGHISISHRAAGPYTPADTQKLALYGTIAGHILQAATNQRRWQDLALSDECTGLANRRHLLLQLDDILARAAREHFHVTFLLFDVDDFKTFNDTFGHDAGDNILRLTGQLISNHCREQDLVARYGGDEFAVVFWDADGARVAGSSHPQCALGVLDRFQAALREQALTAELGALETASGDQYSLTISGGLATYPWDGADRQTLIRKADEALLAAKHAGKNRIFLIGDSGNAGPRQA